MAPPQGTVVVATYYSVNEAELARANLVGAGIEARIEGQHAVGVLPMHAIALGGVRVTVSSSDLARAKELLGALSEAGPATETEPEDETPAGDTWMRQAMFSAFLGLCTCPVVGTFYSLILLFRYGNLPLSPRGRLHRRLAIAFDAIVMVLFLLWQINASKTPVGPG